ncbi:50S ribosomal protein L11 [Thalictrum thalictroides]|uniref:Large ribosomal subunit protein uL11m n=1 Tax=Thalictrum thalictroides TaxID=46969 RepID=A0A7J6VWI2_THATH|nr:50S ribosomal protein L11 [Thalictrum thalictroides]
MFNVKENHQFKEYFWRPVTATIRLTVPAGAARPASPVGPDLGQYRLNLMAFCKDCNVRSHKYKANTPMVVTITTFKDNTFDFTVKSPLVIWYLKKKTDIDSGRGDLDTRLRRTMVSKVRKHLSLQQLGKTRSNLPLKTRISRAWLARNINNKNQIFGYDMVLIDEKGDQIHATVPNELRETYEEQLPEGQIVEINKFDYMKNTNEYHPVPHQYRIKFKAAT